jgi:1-acyl-sn-glycerol-3-phosphate acyltransferase
MSMESQDEGPIGRLVGAMIRRSVRTRFHGLHWIPPAASLNAPVIFACNHHGWHDGYVMYHVVTRLKLRSLNWIQELDAFPPFAKVGGMPYPAGDVARRAATVRRTIRLMKEEKRSLVLFVEGELHYPPDLLPLGRSLDVVASKVPGVTVVPTAIRYEMSMHERPEAFVAFGGPVSAGEDLMVRARDALESTLDVLTTRIREDRDSFELLASGTPDVNERWDMRTMPRKKPPGR